MNKIKDFLLILFSLVICLLTALSIGLFISKPKEEITKYIVDVQSDCIDESLIFSKVKDLKEREYYLRTSFALGWSRNVLLNQIKKSDSSRQ